MLVVVSINNRYFFFSEINYVFCEKINLNYNSCWSRWEIMILGDVLVEEHQLEMFVVEIY